MKQFSKYVGLDVHKETIAVAVAEADGGEPRFFGEIVNTPEAIKKLVDQLSKAGAQLSLCYEAAPVVTVFIGNSVGAWLGLPSGGTLFDS
jgi:transposase